MANYLKQVYRKICPQSEPILGREHEMALNSNAGYVFPANDWTRLERFLILGSEDEEGRHHGQLLEAGLPQDLSAERAHLGTLCGGPGIRFQLKLQGIWVQSRRTTRTVSSPPVNIEHRDSTLR